MYYTKADIEQKDGKIIGIASTSTVDRHGEIVNADGWDLKNFKKAPRLLWAHDHYQPAIGKVTKTWYEGEGKKKRLLFETVFQEVTEMGRAIKQLVKDGFINTFSVGFAPLEMEGSEITKQELLEISVVNVPANPDAMVLAYKALNKAGFDKQTIEEVGIPAVLINRMDNLEERLKGVEDKADIAVKGLQYLAPQRSNQEIVTERLRHSKVIAKTADKLLSGNVSRDKTVSMAKVIKRSSEKLIRSNKGDL